MGTGGVDPQNPAPGDRLSRLSEASRRINESLDIHTVLQEVLDSARALTAGSSPRRNCPWPRP